MKDQSKKKGFTLIESLVAIFVMSLLIFIYANTTYYIRLATELKQTIQAYNIAQEEIEALRFLPFSSLTNQTEGNFLNVLYNQGQWQVNQNGSNNYYETFSQDISDLTSQALLPLSGLSDFDLETDIYIDSDSPANWSTGFFIRAQDKNNNYKIIFNSDNFYFYKTVSGVETEIFSTSLPTTTDSWNTYKISANSNNFEFFRNSTSIGTANDPDTIFDSGKISLIGINGIKARFDNVKINSSLVDNGDFSSGPLGEVAQNWQWLSLYSLPQAKAQLTISDYSSNPNIKQVIAEIEWQSPQKTKNISLETLISKYGIHE
ncbi:MAG: type II secretion system protein [Patescibacteria group bacterium]|nr:type II secretion system protein [Patescibacteria group bacterium]